MILSLAIKTIEGGNILNRFREWLYNFMQNRYGMDQFSRDLNIISIVLFVISLFLPAAHIGMLMFAVIGYSYFRVFSRNISARARENQWYLEKTSNIRRRIRSFISVNKQRKDFHIYTCPNPGCRAKIRIPRGKGKIEVTCPKCHTSFIKNS